MLRLKSKKELFNASQIIKDLFNFKRKFKKSKNINNLLKLKKIDLEHRYKIKIEYLENRKINNFKKINNFNLSKIFIAYYLNKVRLIDNL